MVSSQGQRPILNHAANPDRLAYLWLALATVLLLFAGGRWAVPLAAWLAPVFLLRFVRTQRLLLGIPIAWIARSAASVVVTQGTILYPGFVPYVIVVLVCLVLTLPLVADRLLVPRVGGFPSTLVFPLAYTTVEYLSSFGSFGTYNSIAYSQYGDLPLMQLVSVTGIWGITFLITWFASVVNWTWERGFAWAEVRNGTLVYGAILSVVALGGGARLALFPPEATNVRLAGLSASQAAVTALNRNLSSQTLGALLTGKATQSDRALARSAFAALDDHFLARSQQEARAGAKIVVWPEASPTSASVLQEDEQAFIQRASALARQEGIYLDMGLAVYLADGAKGPFAKDEAVLVGPTGNVVWTYEKTHEAPGDEGLFLLGDGKLPLVDSPYGRLANAICYDLDFASMMRQAGQAGADLMLGPSDDWQAVDPAHTEKATFRAIEDGFSLVRETNKGLSMAVDYEGRVLGASDYFTTDQQVMVAYVPVHGVRTVYSVIGDLFAWLSMVGLVVLSALAITRSRSRRPGAAVVSPSVLHSYESDEEQRMGPLAS